MRILIDGDATPSIDLIIEVANKNKIEPILYIDQSHISSKNIKTVTVSIGNQSVDIKIINDIKQNDILITQDYGLASLALSKNCHVIHPNGWIYKKANIDKLIYERYINMKLRKSNIHLKGSKKRNKQNDQELIDSINTIIIKNKI